MGRAVPGVPGFLPGLSNSHGMGPCSCSAEVCAFLGIKTASKRDAPENTAVSDQGRGSTELPLPIWHQEGFCSGAGACAVSCLYPGRFSNFPRNLTLCVCGGAVSLLEETSTKTEPESEQVCSGTQAPAPGVPSQEAEGRALRRGPVSCSIRSVIPTGPGLSPQRWLGRAGLASSGGGAASHPGHISASGRSVPTGPGTQPAAGASSSAVYLPLEPAAWPCTCPAFPA